MANPNKEQTPEQQFARAMSKAVISQGYIPQALHTYCDLVGVSLYYRIRCKHPDGRKYIRPFYYDEATGTFKEGEPPFQPGKKPAYGQQRLKGHTGIVFVGEGESVIDALARLGIVAVSSGGATSANGCDWSVLQGRNVIIWGDNDTPGRAYVKAVGSKLRDLGIRYRVIDVAALDLPESGDCVDYIAAHPGTTADDILALPLVPEAGTDQQADDADDDGEWPEPSPLGPEAPPPPTLKVLNIQELLTADVKPRSMLLAPCLPRQGLCMIAATRGIGKTHVALSIAVAVASGGEVMGWQAPKPHRVLFLDGEMPFCAIQERLAGIIANSKATIPGPDFLRIITPDVQDWDTNLSIHTPEGQAALNHHVADRDLIIIDNLATLATGGRSNDVESWTPVQEWMLWLRRGGKSVLLIHHAGKSGNQRGTSAKEDILDTSISLRRPDDYSPEEGCRFHVHFEKARGFFGKDAEPFEARLLENHTWLISNLEDSRANSIARMLDEGQTLAEIGTSLNVHKSTVSRICKKHSLLPNGNSNATKGGCVVAFPRGCNNATPSD